MEKITEMIAKWEGYLKEHEKFVNSRPMQDWDGDGSEEIAATLNEIIADLKTLKTLNTPKCYPSQITAT